MPDTRKDKKPQDAPAPVRRNRTEPVARETSNAASAAFARHGFRDPTLVLHWRQIAGEEVARIAQPIHLGESATGGVLTLKAAPGAALFLQHESRNLIGRVNAYLGRNAIVRLKFVQAQLATRPGALRPLSIAKTVASHDPVNRFRGASTLHQSLIGLAKARQQGKSAD